MKVARLSPGRIVQARLAANMSRADLAYAIRSASGGQIKANEQSVRRWEKALHSPSADGIAAIAQATGHDIEFFYTEADPDGDEDDMAALLMAALSAFVDSKLRERVA